MYMDDVDERCGEREKGEIRVRELRDVKENSELNVKRLEKRKRNDAAAYTHHKNAPTRIHTHAHTRL